MNKLSTLILHHVYQMLRERGKESFIPVKQPCGAVSLLILEGRAKVIGAREKILFDNVRSILQNWKNWRQADNYK